MRFGLDAKGEKINISDSVKDGTYRCPVCNGLLVRKCGTQRVHHFAHKHKLCDPWYHDNKGEWHKNMQSHFRPEQCEVRIDGSGGEFHIADVFIEGKNRNMVIEFQHSSMSQKEFDERNRFYSKHGCRVVNGKPVDNLIIWVFDYRERRMFIDLGHEPVFKSENGYRSELTSENDMCASLLQDREKRRKFFLTQTYVKPDVGVYAHINWKRPSRIFSRANSNVVVFFDVVQRRYIKGMQRHRYTKPTWYYKYLSEEADVKCDDTLGNFLVQVSFYRRCNLSKINEGLRSHPENLHGKCLKHEDFFEWYANC